MTNAPVLDVRGLTVEYGSDGSGMRNNPTSEGAICNENAALEPCAVLTWTATVPVSGKLLGTTKLICPREPNTK